MDTVRFCYQRIAQRVVVPSEVQMSRFAAGADRDGPVLVPHDDHAHVACLGYPALELVRGPLDPRQVIQVSLVDASGEGDLPSSLLNDRGTTERLRQHRSILR